MNEKTIPEIVIGRLPRYLQALEHMLQQGCTVTSSKELGEKIGISAAQIRKDLSQYGEFGKQGKGYSVPFLVHKLQQILKVDRIWDMALIGAGNLGKAIAYYQGFIDHGFRVALIFDSDPQKVGQVINEIPVLHTSMMIETIQTHQIKIAMLTVPAQVAQSVTNQLIQAGVKAILNYAPITLTVPDDVHVQYIDPIIHLQRMTYYLD